MQHLKTLQRLAGIQDKRMRHPQIMGVPHGQQRRTLRMTPHRPRTARLGQAAPTVGSAGDVSADTRGVGNSSRIATTTANGANIPMKSKRLHSRRLSLIIAVL